MTETVQPKQRTQGAEGPRRNPPEGSSSAKRRPEQHDRALRKDLKVLAKFISVFCRHRHKAAEKRPVELKNFDLAGLAGRQVRLCPDCSRLLKHAFVKRSMCPLDPKPVCKHCPQHCYAPGYRARIKEVMKYSGRRLVLSGRLDYLVHLFF